MKYTITKVEKLQKTIENDYTEILHILEMKNTVVIKLL